MSSSYTTSAIYADAARRPLAAAPGLTVEAVTSLEAARSRWERLEKGGATTPFQSFTWVSTLCSTIGRSLAAEVFVLIVSDTASGRDLMALPLVRRAIGPITVIEPPDFGVSDYSGPIIDSELVTAPDRFRSIWNRAMAGLPAADLVRVNKIPERIDGRPNPLVSVGGLWRKGTRSWSVELPNSWNEYESQALSSKVRRGLRRYLKRLQAMGSVALVVGDNDATAGTIFDALCDHREARFAKLRRANVLRSAPYREFYREIVRRSLTSGPAVLSALTIDSRIVATMLGLRWRDSYLALIPTMAEGDVQKHGVGKVMNWLQMKEMHGRGCRHFDFTIGNETYKRDYGAQPGELYETVLPLKLYCYPLAWAFKARAYLRRRGEADPHES